ASRDDLAALRRLVHPLARRLATRLAARRRLGRSGRLDMRRTVRASLGTGGVPVVTHHRPRRTHKPELVLLCDLSGSVASFAHFTLLLTWALQEQFTKVRVFAFIDSLDEVTRYLEGTDDLPSALARMSHEAQLVWFDGHSDYGHAFEVFAERYADAITPRTSLLVLGDGRTNYRSLALPVLRRLVGQARHAYWLNPEPKGQWGSGDSAAPAYADVVEMVECRTVAQLEQFVSRLLPA
ncbi:MAG TPA: VWA domain-containing protein, partial [Actinomycetes bacterium]